MTNPTAPAPHLIVVGGGIAGAAVAFRAVQYDLRVCWIRGDRETDRRSRFRWVADVDNMIGFHDGIVRKSILRQLRKPQFADARAIIETKRTPYTAKAVVDNTIERIQECYGDLIEIVRLKADRAERTETGFTVHCGDHSFEAPHLVLATGVMDRQPTIKKQHKGETADEIKWVYAWANREHLLYCIRCEGHLARERDVGVIGHGPAAAGVAMMMHERYGVRPRLLTNGEQPTWSDRAARALDAYGATVDTARVVDFEGDKTSMHAVLLEDGARLELSYALIALGLFCVYNQLARDLGAVLEGGDAALDEQHVLIDHRGETDVPGLFAVGDMTRRPDEPVMKQIYTAQEYAVRAVDAIDARRRAAFREAAIARG
jgi:thioredoxin reductase (NADPH)